MKEQRRGHYESGWHKSHLPCAAIFH